MLIVDLIFLTHCYHQFFVVNNCTAQQFSLVIVKMYLHYKCFKIAICVKRINPSLNKFVLKKISRNIHKNRVTLQSSF